MRRSEQKLQVVAPRGGRERDPLPIAERIGADARHTGRGVVAAFIDSGFYDHPDLTTPHSRIHAYYDVIHDKSGTEHIKQAEVSSWHGMMSTVVAAGNGNMPVFCTQNLRKNVVAGQERTYYYNNMYLTQEVLSDATDGKSLFRVTLENMDGKWLIFDVNCLP